MENQKHTDDVIMEIAGELARIMYTTSSPYHQDPAVKGTVFAGLAMAEGLTRENTEADYYLAGPDKICASEKPAYRTDERSCGELPEMDLWMGEIKREGKNYVTI